MVLSFLLGACSTVAEQITLSEHDDLAALSAKDAPAYLKRKTKLFEPEWKGFADKHKPDKKSKKLSKPKKSTLAAADGTPETQDSAEPLIMAHYMPWFQTPEVSGYWGHHWTMATCEPDLVDANGRRDICAHYYPLVGPYDSSDPDLIDYHITLMQLSGVDGILIDWYGVIDAFDWGVLRDATDLIMEKFNDAGMKVGIVYEDRTIKAALEFGLIRDDIVAGQEVMKYLEENYFSLENYLHVDGVPLLLNFGPEHFTEYVQWRGVFSAMDEEPTYAGLGYIAGISATTFPWIEWPDRHYTLEDYYAWVEWMDFDLSIGSAYFGFHDYYAEGGWGEGLYELPDPTGTRFADLLAYNAAQNPDIIQLNTWNDFGEGTMLEPTAEFGYKYLSDLQGFTGAPYGLEHLELATEYYLLEQNSNEGRKRSASEFRALLLNGELNKAESLNRKLR